MNRNGSVYRHRRFRLLGTILAVVAIGSVIAVVPPGTSPGASAASSVRGVTNNQIVIGGLTYAQSWPGLANGAEARFAQVNRSGGIAGRKIKFIGALDDGGSAATNLANAQQLVEKDGVFAVSPVTSENFQSSTAAFLNNNHTPYVGWGPFPGFCLPNKYGYSWAGCEIGTFLGLPGASYGVGTYELIAKLLKKPIKGLKLAFVFNDNGPGHASGSSIVSLVSALGANASVEYVPASGGATVDFSPYVADLVRSNPAAIVVFTDLVTVSEMTPALKAGGWTGPIVNGVGYLPGQLKSQPALAQELNDSYALSTVPPNVDGGPELAQITKDFKAIHQTPDLGNAAQIGFYSADLLVQILEKVGRNLTQARFQKVASTFTYSPSNGKYGTITNVTYPAAYTGPDTSCAAIVETVGTSIKHAVPWTCTKNLPASAVKTGS